MPSYGATQMRDRFFRGLAHRLPRRLVTWCFMRVVGDATQGPNAADARTLTAMDAVKLWDVETR